MLPEDLDHLVERYGFSGVVDTLTHTYGLARTLDALTDVYDRSGDETFVDRESLLFKSCAVELARVHTRIQKLVHAYERDIDNANHVFTYTETGKTADSICGCAKTDRS